MRLDKDSARLYFEQALEALEDEGDGWEAASLGRMGDFTSVHVTQERASLTLRYPPLQLAQLFLQSLAVIRVEPGAEVWAEATPSEEASLLGE
jgi:hypothetical protein